MEAQVRCLVQEALDVVCLLRTLWLSATGKPQASAAYPTASLFLMLVNFSHRLGRVVLHSHSGPQDEGPLSPFPFTLHITVQAVDREERVESQAGCFGASHGGGTHHVSHSLLAWTQPRGHGVPQGTLGDAVCYAQEEGGGCLEDDESSPPPPGTPALSATK